MPIVLLIAVSSLFGARFAGADEPACFVFPGNGVPKDRPVWGHREGLRIGLAPTPGPHGLVRIYAPYLGQPYPRMVNFISVEPMVIGKEGRGQSELESSRHRPRERGLSFYASEHPNAYSTNAPLCSALLGPGGETLRLFIHSEPFANGALPVIEVVFHRGQPNSIEFRTHAHPDSAPLAECVLSATMGNYGLLRRLHLGNKTLTAKQLWPDPDTPLDSFGFLPWKTFSSEQLRKTPKHGFSAEAYSDKESPSETNYPDSVPKSWRYHGSPAVHAWSTPGPATVAVNARPTYWETSSEIPGGPSIENFELRAPFEPGRSFFFSIKPLPNKS